MRHAFLFNFYLSKIKRERLEVICGPTNFLTFMNNSKAFSSDGIACNY